MDEYAVWSRVLFSSPKEPVWMNSRSSEGHDLLGYCTPLFMRLHMLFRRQSFVLQINHGVVLAVCHHRTTSSPRTLQSTVEHKIFSCTVPQKGGRVEVTKTVVRARDEVLLTWCFVDFHHLSPCARVRKRGPFSVTPGGC